MNRLIRNLTSLEHLTKAGNARGQIATLMVLFLVIVLIFVLVTANIGHVAVSSTSMSNAADAAALQLASSLATKSRLLSEALVAQCGSPLKCCQNTGFASMGIAIVFAVIVCIITWGAATPIMVGACAAAGAAGGAIGGEIAGTGAGKGALQGAIIGAAIGSIGAGLSGAVTQPAGIATGSPAELAAGLSEGTVDIMTTSAGDIFITKAVEAGAGSVILGSLSGASTIGLEAYNQHEIEKNMEDFVGELGKLNESDRYRETAFYTALSQVADDPNRSQDINDVNKNGDTEEFLPDLVILWYQRLEKLGQIADMQRGMVYDFINGPLTTFSNFLHMSIEGGSQTIWNWWGPVTTDVEPLFKNADYGFVRDETGALTITDGTEDGDFVSLLRALWNMGHRLTVNDHGTIATGWEPGPAAAELQAWATQSCPDGACPGDEPAGFDYIDLMYLALTGMMKSTDGIIQEIDSAVMSWEYWLNFCYDASDPTDTGTYYGKLLAHIDILTQLITQIEAIRDNYPECNYGYYEDPANDYQWPTGWPQVDPNIPCLDCVAGCTDPTSWPGWCLSGCMDSCFLNSPCRITGLLYDDGFSIDPDRRDELTEAKLRIDELLRQADALKDAIENFYNNVSNAYGALYMTGLGTCPSGSISCIYYAWEDSRGGSSVMVNVGPFKLPTLEECEYGNFWKGEVCLELRNYTDENNCWVEITRSTTVANIGEVGVWNPFGPRPLKKRSVADYSYDHVELK